MSGLVLEDVSHRYDSFLAVDGVNLEVAPGEIICLLGPSGCGKSTLLRLAAGLETLQAGRISLDGEVMASGGAARQTPPEARGVGLMFQDYALFPHLTVLENIRYGLTLARAEGQGRARRALEQLGMAHLAGHYPHELSGGQQQRVALLRALAPPLRAMLLDEPFSTLDEHLRHEVRMETIDLLERSGAATIIVTHDAEEAMLLADRIVVMRAGRIVQDASPEEVHARPADLFTARLFGLVNHWREVVAQGSVATPLGRIAAPAFAESAPVDVAVRVDAIALEHLDEAPAHWTRAEVASVRHLGASTLVTMTPIPVEDAPLSGMMEEAGAGQGGRAARIQVRVPGKASFGVGERFALEIDPAQVFLFPAADGE